MAKGGAYYAAAGVANQVQPVDFGSIAKGFANVAESKRLEAKADAKYRQDFLMKQQELFGDEVIGEFDGTGIDNVDGVASKVKTAIKKHAEILNSLYEEGKISESQLNSRMRKLSSASAQYRGMVGNISNFIQKHNELGGKSSKYNEMVIERLNSFTEDMLPTVDENSDLAFLSKGGKTGIAKTSMSKFQNMLSAKEGVNDSELFQGVMAGIKPSTEIKKDKDGNTVVSSTYLNNGELGSNTTNYISSYVEAKSDDELIDLAIKNDIANFEDAMNLSDKERKSLKSEIKNVLSRKTKDYLIGQEFNNEKEGFVLDLQQGNYNLNVARGKREQDKFEKEMRTVMPPEEITETYNGKSVGGTSWSIPVDKQIDIAAQLGSMEVAKHTGRVQLTQLQRLNIGTAEAPVYKYKAKLYITSKNVKEQDLTLMTRRIAELKRKEGNQEEIDALISQMGGGQVKYEYVELPESTVRDLSSLYEAEWIPEKNKANKLFIKPTTNE